MIRPTFLIIIFFTVLGCNGGPNCPLIAPQCCTNALFGCGTFDLPFGCTCDDYGYSLHYKNLMTRSTTPKTLSGNWHGTLEKRSSTCPNSPPRLSGSIKINLKGSRVSFVVPGYGTLRGSISGRRGNVKGRYQLLGCSTNLSADVSSITMSSMNISVSSQISCGSLLHCSATYQGSLRR